MMDEEQLRSPGKWTWITSPRSNIATIFPGTFDLFLTYDGSWTFSENYFFL